ncbi:hypothetical protein LEP1GSC036_2759 [Leptospira weilii str. 2006001853]|uniref:Uncharacterized protein n=1 Tax=Leptospira weilii str. 2006001853 TaxID=1001589 RepID=A0A828Z4S9_9LEPT|nr:hypothetical protein LEP1GSC036_2759 [Leptospira weilii str. 2006001853]
MFEAFGGFFIANLLSTLKAGVLIYNRFLHMSQKKLAFTRHSILRDFIDIAYIMSH